MMRGIAMNSHLHLLAVLSLAIGCSEASELAAPVCLGPSTAEVPAPGAVEVAQLSPAQYLALNGAAMKPLGKDWANAVIELAVAGDGFTLQQLRTLDRSQLPPESQALLDDTLGSLAAHASDTAASVLPVVQPRLERAAWADLHCDPLEHSLVPWAVSSIAPFSSDPAVRAELERLRDLYEFVGTDATAFGPITGRVRKFAGELLASPNPDVQARTR